MRPGRQPAVSAVIVFWNAAPFISDAIESVLGQSYDDWELLLVDDGSNDGGSDIALRYAATDPARIHYLEHVGHANLGMSVSRNLGLREARGEHVAFLDADDVWFENALADQVAILERHRRAALAYGPIQWWYGWTGRPEDLERDYVEELGVEPNSLIEPPRLLALFLQDRAAVPSGILVRRDAALRVGGFEDAFRGEYEDQAFLAKICLVEPVYAAASCWYRYRQHDNSAVAIGLRTGATKAARMAFLAWLDGHLSRHASPAVPEVRRALNEEWQLLTRPAARSFWKKGEGLARMVAGRLRGRS